MRGPRRSNPPAPEHRPIRCPRVDCPDPTLGFRFKGSDKQLQYHCYGCWRVFNDGGKQRAWAEQTKPTKKWLLARDAHLRGKPKLLRPPRPSARPSSAVHDGDATLNGVPASTVLPVLPDAAVPNTRAVTTRTAGAHSLVPSNAAGPSRRQSRRRDQRAASTDLPDVAVPRPKRIATRTAGAHSRVPSKAAGPSRRVGVLGDEHGLASDFDYHIADVGGHGSRTSSTAAWEEDFRLSAFLTIYGDHLFDDSESIPAWASIDSPIADAPGGNEVGGADILPAPASLPSAINSDNSKSASNSKSPDATYKHRAGPSAETRLKLKFKRYTTGTLILNLPGIKG